MRLIAVVPAVLLVAGCTSSRTASPVPESRLKVAALEVGRSVGPDKRVDAPAEAFSPDDTIYASVVTEGSLPRATLAARWTRDGALLEETTQRIAPEGTAVSEFHISNPAGWAPGSYRIEILLDGRALAQREFRVEPSSRG